MWLVHQFIVDDSSPQQFVGTYAIVDTEAQADAVIESAPKARSIVDGYAYSKQKFA